MQMEQVRFLPAGSIGGWLTVSVETGQEKSAGR